ncbi:MAG: tyrosine-type recombinase/integrase [Candidatus Thermoplasmatota archaeon]|nr:tyrosine-type recombinase/integrase [Candidatus Thermoplasmatota archaeon]
MQFKSCKNGKKPEDLITPDEFNKLLNYAGNTRNKALISLLYDSGCRIGEILGMRRQDITFDQYGAKLNVSVKTRYRKVYVLGTSVRFAKMWLKKHPIEGLG